MKKTMLVCVCLAILLVFTGCGKSVPNKKAISQDITGAIFSSPRTAYLEDEFGFPLDDLDLSGYSLDSVEISKRRTDEENKMDTVYVDIIASDEEKEARFNCSCTLQYGLYNEGWFLEDIYVQDVFIEPLAASSFSEKEINFWITSTLADYGYTNLEDINVYDHTTDLELGVDRYSFTANDIYPYMNNELDMNLNFDFVRGRWRVSESVPFYPNNESVTWDICGEWVLEDDGYLCELSIFSFNGDEIKLYRCDTDLYGDEEESGIYEVTYITDGRHKGCLSIEDSMSPEIIIDKNLGVIAIYSGEDMVFVRQ